MTFDEWYAPLNDEPPWNGTRIKQIAKDAWDAALSQCFEIAMEHDGLKIAAVISKQISDLRHGEMR